MEKEFVEKETFENYREKVGERMGAIEVKNAEIKTILDFVRGDVSEIKTDIGVLNSNFSKVEKGISELNGKNKAKLQTWIVPIIVSVVGAILIFLSNRG